MFVESLYRGWMEAHQAADADPDETAKLLLAHMEDDPYGFAYHLERDAVKVMNKKSLAAFERVVRVRFNDTRRIQQAAEPQRRCDPAYARRRLRVWT
jgi:hypothetical protein